MRHFFIILCLGIALSLTSHEAHAEARLHANTDKAVVGTLTSDSIVLDNNADPTAMVEIVSELDGLDFSNNVFNFEKKDLDNGKGFAYFVYILDGTNKLLVSHDDYIYTTIDFPSPLKGGESTTGIIVFGNKFDTETVNVNQETDTYKVVLDYDDYADLYIDTQKHDDRDSIFLEEGTHRIKVQYGNYSDSKDINVRPRLNHTNLWLSGNVVLKGVDGSGRNALRPIGNAPDPILKYSHNGKVKYNHMLGKYHLMEYANTHAWVDKDITVGVRTHNVFRLDEMVGYLCFMYHGTHWQPIGLNVAYCKDFGGFVSWSTDLRFSIDTPYGKVEFKDKEGKDDWRTTAMTFSAGPMFKVVRKLYAQVGGGAVRYLSTSENKVLTGDYKYKWGGSACCTLFYRLRNIIFGAGYTHQFMNHPFNSGWRNQVNFSIGWAKGQN